MLSQHSCGLRLLTIASATALFGGCTVYQAPPTRVVYVQSTPAPAPVYSQPVPVDVEATPQPVVSVYIEPPILQPEPILIGWAPPPMLVETVTPMPYPSAVWIGGYWVWEGRWVWAAGRWASPPQLSYAWVHPYYENRDGAVVFITGHWCPPGVAFVPPPIGLRMTLVTPALGVTGVRPIGPLGVFVPAPPGSRAGLIIPAPIGTPPAVVTSAAPVINVGMRIQSNSTRVTNTTNTTTINNVTNVTIVAPATATASGKAYESAVPAQAHLAAALPPVVRMNAPTPVSTKPIPAYTATRSPVALPAPQAVRTGAAAPPARPVADTPTTTPSPAPTGNVATASAATRDRGVERSAQPPSAAAPGQARVVVAEKPQPPQRSVTPRPETKVKDAHEQKEHAAKSERQAKRSEEGDKERSAR